MKWVTSSICLVFLYAFAVTFCFWSDTPWLAIFGLLYLAMSVVNAVLAIHTAVTAPNSPQACRQMSRVMLFVKLDAIPFFIANYVLWICVFAFSVILPLGFTLWIFIPIAVIATYIVLLTTTAFSIPTIVLLARSKQLKPFEAIVHIVLQFIFVLDVIDVVYISIALRKKKSAAVPAP